VTTLTDPGRITPPVVRLDIPMHDERDLPQIVRRLRKLADQLQLLHSLPDLTEKQKIFRGQMAVRETGRQLKKELKA
jgi:hypothetical protein